MELFKQSLKMKDVRNLKAGKYHFSLPPHLTKNYRVLNDGRAAAVTRAMKHLWSR